MLTAQIGTLTTRIEQLITAMEDHHDHHDHDASGTAEPAVTASVSANDQTTAPGHVATTAISETDTATVIECKRLTPVERLDEITGVGERAAQTIIAEIGLDMTRFPTPEHLDLLGQTMPKHHPVRSCEPRRQDRQR